MIHTGSQYVAIDAPCAVSFRADGPFTLYAGDEETKQVLLGPRNSTDRVWRGVLPDSAGVHVRCTDSCMWHMEAVAIPPTFEVPDPTPMEVPLELRGMSFTDEIKQFVRQELQMQKEMHEMESFEEANDFEMDDEDDDGTIMSGYQYEEMDSENSLDNQGVTEDNDVSRETTETSNERADRSVVSESDESGAGERNVEAEASQGGQRAGGDVQRHGDDAGRNRQAPGECVAVDSGSQPR